MDDLIEIRIHGRGGQGTVTFAALLADAAFESGWHVLGFPAFGTERTGAPVAAFVRISRSPIRDRTEIRRPSVIIVQDATLIGTVDVLAGVSDDGVILLNGANIPQDLRARAQAIPATAIALQHLGSAKTSTAMLGFLAGGTGIVSIEAVIASIERRFTGEVAERNVRCARAAYEAARDGRSAA